jgi:hypothetical protein
VEHSGLLQMLVPCAPSHLVPPFVVKRCRSCENSNGKAWAWS